MIPQRFVAEYPKRCLDLLAMLEPQARQSQLLGSFSLLVASSMLTVPYERMNPEHPLSREGREGDLNDALRGLAGKDFLEAPFWNETDPGEWRFSRIMKNQNNSERWVDEDGQHPIARQAKNSIAHRRSNVVIRVIRDALAHGNVVYLDATGHEKEGAKLEYLGFLACCDINVTPKTYHIVATTDENFLQFIKAWAVWIAGFRYDTSLSEAA